MKLISLVNLKEDKHKVFLRDLTNSLNDVHQKPGAKVIRAVSSPAYGFWGSRASQTQQSNSKLILELWRSYYHKAEIDFQVLALKYQALFYPEFSTILEHLLKSQSRVSQLLQESCTVGAGEPHLPTMGGEHRDNGEQGR